MTGFEWFLVADAVATVVLIVVAARRVAWYRNQYGKALALATATSDERDKAKARYDDLFSRVDGIVREKEDVWSLYRENARGAGVAQAWLMREYTAALRSLNAYRARSGEPAVEVPVELREIVEEFSEEVAGISANPPVIQASKS
jgi:hypothetical protein